MLGDVLIHPTLQIRKPPLERILADSTTADLVGHEDKRGFLSCETVELGLNQSEDILHIGTLSLKEIIGQPQRDAVDDHHTPTDIMTTQRLLLLDVRPLRSSTLLMEAHALTELIVPNVSRSQIDGIGRAAISMILRVIVG